MFVDQGVGAVFSRVKFGAAYVVIPMDGNV